MAPDLVQANGVNGLTGEYLLGPLTSAEVAERGRRPEDAGTALWLRLAHDTVSEPHFGLPFDVDPARVEEAGWGVVVSTADSSGALEGLAPLIERRRAQVGDHVRILDHRPGESWPEWLGRHGVGPGTLDPGKVPYYLLLAGSPALIPFTFQYLLDVEYAVGRADFASATGYRAYAEAVVSYEEAARPPHDDGVVFFGTRHDFDAATELSADRLVRPLADCFGAGGRYERIGGDRIRTVLGSPATKEALAGLLDGSGPHGRPALLFAATHGLGGWPPGHPDQLARQGALLCQDWPGTGRIDPAHYYASIDLAGAHPHGLIAFLFACYGAGTPQRDPFARRTLAPEPFVAALPRRLLEGGALAVIGHVERAWGYSFMFAGQTQLVPFQNAIGRILRGSPVGYAMKDFNERYAALSAGLSDVLSDISNGRTVPDADLARLWTERNDAQNYILLGDPAVTSRPA
jgi:hypothetical protein